MNTNKLLLILILGSFAMTMFLLHMQSEENIQMAKQGLEQRVIGSGFNTNIIWVKKD